MRSKPQPSQLVLRPEYQVPAVDALREAMRRHRRVLLVLPTGAGKTAIASYIAKGVAERARRVYFCCHRTELVEQTSATWSKYGIGHGFIAANRPAPSATANVCSIDTLRHRLLSVPEPEVAVWDEAHHLGAAGWQAIMNHWSTCWHIGLTASPWRLDGVGLGRQFDEMVEGPSTAWLMERGYLSSYEIFAPNPPDMTGVRRQAGDYSRREAAERMDVPKRIGDMLTHWRRHAHGMRTVAFGVNVADSRMIVDRFNGAGVPSAHLDADTPKDERARVIRDFAAGRLTVVSNVGLFGEGFDLSAIAQTDVTVDCLIDAAPTQSLAAVLQRWGRVLRPKDYAAVILDHAGNSNRHGFPDDPREWSLADREKTGRGGKADPDAPPPPFTCRCFRQIRRPLPSTCPHCGESLQAMAKPVEEGEGELRRMTAEDRAAARAARKREEAAATDLNSLAALARRRGYSNPTAWALRKFSNSAWRRRIADDSARGKDGATR